MSGWIGVDLDGTLAYYKGWTGGGVGDPVPEMAKRVRQWLAAGREVRIVTARVGVRDGAPNKIAGIAEDKFVDEQRAVIQDWTEKHFGVRLPVTASKDFGMIELWDDRCVQVEQNTGRIIGAPRELT